MCIHTLRRFVAIRGYPKIMRSDNGSQLVASSKEIDKISAKWDWEMIKLFDIESGMIWKTNKSTDAPWENGCSESLIKSVKRCLKSSEGEHVMTFSELQTVAFEVSNNKSTSYRDEK